MPHPTPRELEGFVLGRLSPAEMREVARHLLAGCSQCQEVTAELWTPEDVFEDPQTLNLADEEVHDGYDEVLDRVFEKILATEAHLTDQRSLGRKLYEELMFSPKSPLSRAQREMIAVAVSRANECHY